MSANANLRQDPEPAAAPQVLGGVVPYLTVAGAAKAAEFYGRAFGAKEVFRHPVDEQGRTMHIHLHVNGGSVMLSDPYPEHGHPLKEPQSFTLHLMVDDIDAWGSAPSRREPRSCCRCRSCSGVTATASSAIPSASAGRWSRPTGDMRRKGAIATPWRPPCIRRP